MSPLQMPNMTPNSRGDGESGKAWARGATGAGLHARDGGSEEGENGRKVPTSQDSSEKWRRDISLKGRRTPVANWIFRGCVIREATLQTGTRCKLHKNKTQKPPRPLNVSPKCQIVSAKRCLTNADHSSSRQRADEHRNTLSVTDRRRAN